MLETLIIIKHISGPFSVLLQHIIFFIIAILFILDLIAHRFIILLRMSVVQVSWLCLNCGTLSQFLELCLETLSLFVELLSGQMNSFSIYECVAIQLLIFLSNCVIFVKIIIDSYWIEYKTPPSDCLQCLRILLLNT